MNILIIKTGALGDVVRTSFLAQAFKDKFKAKEPKIFWITQEKAKPLFINNPYIDYTIIEKDKEKLRNIEFDLIVNLEEDMENCKFASSIKSKNKIGFLFENNKVIPTKTTEEWFNMSSLGEKPLNNIFKKKNKKSHRQIIGEIAGVHWKKYEPFLRLAKKQREFTNDFLRRYNLSRSELIVGINTGFVNTYSY